MASSISVVFNRMKPYLVMVALQFGYAGMYVITLVSLNHGFSHWILVVYRHAIAAAVFLPFAYFLEKGKRPKMTKSVIFKAMLLAFLEPVLDQNLYYVGMQYTSATFTAALGNVIPAFTFLLAVICRVERVNLKKSHSLAKVMGTLITLAGALLMTLYHGPVVDILFHFHRTSHHKAAETAAAHHNWVTGTIMLLSCSVGYAIFFVLQNNTLEEYPAELSLTSLICLFGFIEGTAVAAVMEHDRSAWAIGFDSRLLAAAYSGIVCSGVAYYVQGIVNRSRGPVFVTAFTPLSMIITAILGAIVLAEQVHLGSLIGAIIIVLGLYSVIWGKNKEMSASKRLIYDQNKAAEMLDKETSNAVETCRVEIAVQPKIHEKETVQLVEP